VATSDIGEQLRRAIQAGNFACASMLIPDFRAELTRELASARNNADRARKLQRAVDSMADSLHLARVVRAHIAAKLRDIQSESRYHSQTTEESRWSINA
jgi:hypothetical protein